MNKFVSLLLLFSQAHAAMVLFNEESGENEVYPSVDCTKQVESVCAYKQTIRGGDLLFDGLTNKLTCLTEKQTSIEDQCFMAEIESTMNVITDSSDSACKDELRGVCGKQIDEFKKAVQQTSIIGTVKGAVDVVECIVTHAEDLWKKCKPKSYIITETAELLKPSCSVAAANLCPATEHKILGLGFTLGCLGDKVDELGVTCVKEEMASAIEAAETSQDHECHDELRKKCGKQIDQLKKDIQETSVVGALKSAVDVVQCVAQNAEDLWNHCKPFDATKKPTNKPTLKPTHKPTVKPTPKPTPKPISTSKPTFTSLTGKPTIHKIMETIVLDNAEQTTVAVAEEESVDEVLIQDEKRDGDDRRKWHPHDHDDDERRKDHRGHDDEERRKHDDDDEKRHHEHRDHDDEERHRKWHHDDDEKRHKDHRDPEDEERHRKWHHDHDRKWHHHGEMPVAVAQMSSVEVDMDACVRAAREVCANQVAKFNESPFDRRLFMDLNDCVEAHSAEIEAACTTSSSSTLGYFQMMHPPCRHPNDKASDLPLCEPRHHCRKRRGIFMAFGALVFTVLVVKAVRRRYGQKRCCQTEQVTVQPAQRTVDGVAYNPIKSDNAPAVPASNIV